MKEENTSITNYNAMRTTNPLLDVLLNEYIEAHSDADNRASLSYICRNCGYVGRIINNEIQHSCINQL